MTTEANDLVARVHDRMPVILAREDEARWLDPAAGPDALKALLRPFPAKWMHERRVSRQVNDSTVEGPGLVEPDAQSRLF